MKKILFVLLLLLFITTSSCANKKIEEQTPTGNEEKTTIELGYYPKDLVKDETLIKELQDQKYNENSIIVYKGNKYYRLSENQFFLCAPIEWDLTIIGEEKIYVSRYILDQHVFLQHEYVDVIGTSYSKKPGVPTNTYSNDYTYSDLREWLNQDFMSIAFTQEEIDKLDKVTIDGLNDYIYTLSKEDVSSLTYPYTKPTEYAESKGCDVWTNTELYPQIIGNGTSWLRTPNKVHGYRVAAINYDGKVYEYVDCYYVGVGVRPAIKLK